MVIERNAKTQDSELYINYHRLEYLSPYKCYFHHEEVLSGYKMPFLYLGRMICTIRIGLNCGVVPAANALACTAA